MNQLTQKEQQDRDAGSQMVLGQQNGNLPTPLAETSTAAFAAQQRALIEARYIMAMQRPRDMDQVRERMLKDARRPSFAAVARYHKPVGKGVEGPSIRFVEAALRNMGNLITETATIFDDEGKRIVRVSVTDFEANVIYSQDVTVTKTVERKQLKQGDVPISSRLNSYGQMTYLLPGTDDDVLNKQNALISKAVRTLGLRVIPGDLVDEAMRLVLSTQRNEDARDPDAAKRAILDSFASIGVTAAGIRDWLGHDAAALTPKELTDLRAIYSAIRDGETTWKSVMDEKRKKDDGDGDGGHGNGNAPEGGRKKPSSLKEALSSKPEGSPAASEIPQATSDDDLFG